MHSLPITENLQRQYFRRIVGLLLGLGYTIVFYLFQVVGREIMRLLATTDDYVLWILNPEEVYFYNWFFAALALVIGQSICLVYWFERPVKFRSGSRRKRTSILNDQRVLQTNFLMWFFKLAFFYGIYFGLNSYSHLEFSFYPDFKIIPILVIIILFFQSWNSIRLVYKRKSRKWMWLSFLSLCVLSLSMAKIDVVDYKGANDKLLESNLNYSYNFELPTVKNCQNIMYDSSLEEIILFIDSTRNNQIRLKMDDRMYLTYDSGEFNLNGILGSHSENRNYALHIDKTIEIKYVRILLNELRDNNIFLINYGIKPESIKFEEFVYSGFVYSTRLPFWTTEKKLTHSYSNEIEVIHNQIGGCFVNGNAVNYNELENVLFECFKKEPDFIIGYKIDESFAFNEYMQFKVCASKAIKRLRSIDTWDKYGLPFEEIGDEMKWKLERKYPLRIAEIIE